MTKRFVPQWTVTLGGYDVSSCDECPYFESNPDLYNQTTDFRCGHPENRNANLNCDKSNDYDFNHGTMIHPNCPLKEVA